VARKKGSAKKGTAWNPRDEPDFRVIGGSLKEHPGKRFQGVSRGDDKAIRPGLGARPSGGGVLTRRGGEVSERKPIADREGIKRDKLAVSRKT